MIEKKTDRGLVCRLGNEKIESLKKRKKKKFTWNIGAAAIAIRK